MATIDDKQLLDEGLELLAEEEADEKDLRVFEQMASKIEDPSLQDEIVKRYEAFGKQLLADALPSHVDPRIAKILEPILGDVSNVRVHTGSVASAAAQAMDARAFAVGSQDIFIDASEFDPRSKEGGTLLAHEIAHTRDADTGFALSARHGQDTSAREAFAHEVEFEFAREWEDEGEAAVREDDEPVDSAGPGGTPAEPKVDKVWLAELTYRVLERQQKAGANRIGAWQRS